MKMTVKIRGMMCPHCEAHMQQALEKLEGVKVLRVSHADGCAEIETAAPVAEDVLRRAVTDAGYEFLGI